MFARDEHPGRMLALPREYITGTACRPEAALTQSMSDENLAASFNARKPNLLLNFCARTRGHVVQSDE